MILLLDIGNTHTHAGWATARRIVRHRNVPSPGWFDGSAGEALLKFLDGRRPEGVMIAGVVPRAVPRAREWAQQAWAMSPSLLEPGRVSEIGIDYPRPETIGADRLANAIAARHHFGAPAVVVDFGTAVTFDVVNGAGDYAGGIIAPGLAAMTDYLHEKTALLPRIRIREVRSRIGKNTEEAMLIGAVHGYRGLIQGLLRELKDELGVDRMPVVFTGGCARLMAVGLPEIDAVDPLLTLEGLRLVWLARNAKPGPRSS